MFALDQLWPVLAGVAGFALRHWFPNLNLSKVPVPIPTPTPGPTPLPAPGPIPVPTPETPSQIGLQALEWLIRIRAGLAPLSQAEKEILRRIDPLLHELLGDK